MSAMHAADKLNGGVRRSAAERSEIARNQVWSENIKKELAHQVLREEFYFNYKTGWWVCFLVWLFACLFACLLVCLFACLLACLHVCLFAFLDTGGGEAGGNFLFFLSFTPFLSS